MNNQTFIIRFEGREADAHLLDLRKLAESLAGVEQIINIGLFSILRGDLPKHSKRLPLVVRASMPRRGSFEMEVFLAIGQVLLGSFPEKISFYLEIFWKYLSLVLLDMGDRANESRYHSRDLYLLLREIESNRHEEQMEMLNSQKLLSAAKQVVSPIGTSCERIIFQTNEGETEIDIRMATAIRSKNSIRTGGMEKFRIRVLGFSHHNKRLKVSLTGKENNISAQVRDPAFDHVPNIYTTAATNQEWLEVKAKARRLNDGEIKELYIFDAAPVTDRGNDNNTS